MLLVRVRVLYPRPLGSLGDYAVYLPLRYPFLPAGLENRALEPLPNQKFKTHESILIFEESVMNYLPNV